MAHECIRMDDLNTFWLQARCLKILEVGSYEIVGIGLYCRRKYVSVIRVFEGQCCYPVFISFNFSIRESLIHQIYGPVNALGVQIRPVFQEVSPPFLMDRFAPKRLEQIIFCQTQQQIPDWCRVEYIGIEQC